MTKLPCDVCGLLCAALAFTTSRRQCRLLCNEPRVFAMASYPEYGAVLHRVGRTNSARFVRMCNSTLGRVGWMPPRSTAVGMCIEVARTRTGQRQLVVVIVKMSTRCSVTATILCCLAIVCADVLLVITQTRLVRVDVRGRGMMLSVAWVRAWVSQSAGVRKLSSILHCSRAALISSFGKGPCPSSVFPYP